MTRRMILLAVIVLAINFVSSSTVLSCGQPTEGTKVSPAVPAVEDFIEGHYWALIIGIDKYPTMDKDKQLAVARKDAEAVATLLRERYGFMQEHMIELYDETASRKGIIRAFSALVERLTDKDSLFIYYAGRGGYEDEVKKTSKEDRMEGMGYWIRMGYWIPSDGALDDPASPIFNSQVRDYMANIPARHIYLVADSAFSGALMARTRALGTQASLKEFYREKSRWVLASGGLYPVPDISDKSKNGHSVFAWYFMKILQQNTNLYLLAKDIAEVVVVRVSNEVKDQLPRSSPVVAAGDDGGQFVFRLQRDLIERKQPEEASLKHDLCLPLGSLKEAEEALKKQQEEMAKKKQEMLERIKKAE